MSKRQDKIAAARKEQQKFLAERKAIQWGIFNSNFEAGLKIYEANKGKLSEEERATIEKEIEENRAALKKLEDEINQATEA